jgi:hypothetical protein
MDSCSACRGQILNQNQATSNLLVAFEFLRLLYPPECAGGGARDRVVVLASFAVRGALGLMPVELLQVQ